MMIRTVALIAVMPNDTVNVIVNASQKIGSFQRTPTEKTRYFESIPSYQVYHWIRLPVYSRTRMCVDECIGCFVMFIGVNGL